jgi:predicted transcriptional regulator of viral defense system
MDSPLEGELDTNNIRFGPNESKLIFTLEKDEKTLFTIKDAKEILGTSNKAVYRVLDRLKLKRRIKQIRGGLYLLSPARSGVEGAWTEHIFTILPKLLKDNYYVGFWSALSYWGMTEQIPQTTYVVVVKRRRNLIFDDRMIQFVTYPDNRFFGYVQEKLGETGFSISTREKTIVDSLTHPELAGGISEVAKSIWTSRDEIDINQLIDYARRMRVRAVCLRLGYILELLGFGKESYETLSPEKPTGAPWLDPSATKKQIRYSSRWGLRLNLPEKVILHWK